MVGNPRRLVAFGVAAAVFAGFLIGWTLGLVEADLVSRMESTVFVALSLLFAGSAIGFVIEFLRGNGDSS